MLAIAVQFFAFFFEKYAFLSETKQIARTFCNFRYIISVLCYFCVFIRTYTHCHYANESYCDLTLSGVICDASESGWRAVLDTTDRRTRRRLAVPQLRHTPPTYQSCRPTVRNNIHLRIFFVFTTTSPQPSQMSAPFLLTNSLMLQCFTQAPLLTCQNRIEIKSKNEEMIYAKRLSEQKGDKLPATISNSTAIRWQRG